jgi:hypothetical protein
MELVYEWFDNKEGSGGNLSSQVHELDVAGAQRYDVAGSSQR